MFETQNAFYDYWSCNQWIKNTSDHQISVPDDNIFQKCTCKNYEAKKLISGNILAEGKSKYYSSNLLKQTSIEHLSITVTPHCTLNIYPGVTSEG